MTAGPESALAQDASRVDAEGAARVSRRVLSLTALVAAVGGALISTYLTVAHLQPALLVCTTGGVIDCGAVTSSSFSVIGGTGIPVALGGVLWFAVSGALAFAALRSRHEVGWLAPAHLAWGGVGVLYALYLVWAEVVVIHRVCEWCTATHVLILLTFLVALRRLQLA